MSTVVTVRRVSYSDVFSAPNAQELISAYAAECSIPNVSPQLSIYESMERAGALSCIAAFAGDALIGFVSIVFANMPHTGKRTASIESLYVTPSYRDTGAASDLLLAAEIESRDSGSIALLYTARLESALDVVLSRRPGCTKSHVVYTRLL